MTFWEDVERIQNEYRMLQGLPPIKKPVEHHDFRDQGNPNKKVYPLTSWQSWERKDTDPKDPPFGGRT